MEGGTMWGGTVGAGGVDAGKVESAADTLETATRGSGAEKGGETEAPGTMEAGSAVQAVAAKDGEVATGAAETGPNGTPKEIGMAGSNLGKAASMGAPSVGARGDVERGGTSGAERVAEPLSNVSHHSVSIISGSKASGSCSLSSLSSLSSGCTADARCLGEADDAAEFTLAAWVSRSTSRGDDSDE